MGHGNRLALLGLPVALVAFYILLNWTSSIEIPTFHSLKPVRPTKAALQSRKDVSSLSAKKNLWIGGEANRGAKSDIHQNGEHRFAERQEKIQKDFSITESASTSSAKNLVSDQTVGYTMKSSYECDKSSLDSGFDELLRRYRYCMRNLVTIVQEEGKGASKSPKGEERLEGQKSSEGLGFLRSRQWLEVAGRLATVKKGCRTPMVEFTGAPDFSDVVFDQTHHLAYCRHGKAGTTSLLSYFLSLNNVDPTSMDAFQLHHRIFQLLPIPSKESRKDLLQRSFSFTVVRHPFRRLVSAYCNKKVESNLGILREDIRKMSADEREHELLKFKYRVELGTKEPAVMVGPWIRRTLSDRLLPVGRKADDSLLAHYLRASNFNVTTIGTTSNVTKDNLPQRMYAKEPEDQTPSYVSQPKAFRNFVLGVVLQLLECESAPSCIGDTDVHIRPQVIRWNPCVLNFDMIMKLETLDRDIEMMTELLGLPDLVEQDEDNHIERSGLTLDEGRNGILKPERIPKSQRRKRAVDKGDFEETEYSGEEVPTYKYIDDAVPIEYRVGKTTPVGLGNLREISDNKAAKFTQEESSEIYSATGFFQRNTSAKKCATYEEYMKQLTRRDIDLLYTAYYLDFKLFGYEPLERYTN